MSDQTPVTDDDRRHLREDAQDTLNQPLSPRAAMRLAEYVLDTVPAPPKSLADELREYAKDYATVSRRSMLRILADRVEAVVQERDEARAEVERLTEQQKRLIDQRNEAQDLVYEARKKCDEARAENKSLIHNRDARRGQVEKALAERDEARAEVERLSRQVADQMTAIHTANAEVQRLTTELARKEASRQHYIRHAQTSSDDRALLRDEVKCLKDEVAAFNDAAKASAEEAERLTSGRTSKESLPVALPDPADVPKGEPWLVRDGQELAVGVRDTSRWVLIRLCDVTMRYRKINEVTLVSRLVSDTRRVIDRPEMLDAMAAGSVILDHDADSWTRHDDALWYCFRGTSADCEALIDAYGPVTVVHEPMIDSGDSGDGRTPDCPTQG